MHGKIIFTLLIALVIFYLSASTVKGQTSTPASGELADCSYDRDKLLALDQEAFDQDINGGWRVITRNESCIGIAADLIRDYRINRKLESYILYWHEGQLRAAVGQNAKAIELFEKSRQADDLLGWNLYVDATIAFLRSDKAELLKTRETLAQLPVPANFKPVDQSGNPVKITWPPNLDVVDRLIACYGQTYLKAYRHCDK